MLIFHSFKASGSKFSRLHQQLPKSFKEASISLRHLGKSILAVNLYLGLLEIILLTLASRSLIFWRKNVIILSLCTQCCHGRHDVSRKSINHLCFFRFYCIALFHSQTRCHNYNKSNKVAKNRYNQVPHLT